MPRRALLLGSMPAALGLSVFCNASCAQGKSAVEAAIEERLRRALDRAKRKQDSAPVQTNPAPETPSATQPAGKDSASPAEGSLTGRNAAAVDLDSNAFRNDRAAVVYRQFVQLLQSNGPGDFWQFFGGRNGASVNRLEGGLEQRRNSFLPAIDAIRRLGADDQAEVLGRLLRDLRGTRSSAHATPLDALFGLFPDARYLAVNYTMNTRRESEHHHFGDFVRDTESLPPQTKMATVRRYLSEDVVRFSLADSANPRRWAGTLVAHTPADVERYFSRGKAGQ
jgi:hypothetical protein